MPTCLKCGKEHAENSETFIKVVGDIYLGNNSGVIGGKPTEGTGAVTSYFCVSCFIEEFKDLQSKLIQDLKDKKAIIDATIAELEGDTRTPKISKEDEETLSVLFDKKGK